MKKQFSFAGFFLLCVVTACSSPKELEKTDSKKSGFFSGFQKKTTLVRVYPVTTKQIPLVVTGEGRTEYSDVYQGKANAPIRVDHVLVEEGKFVEAGEGLVKFNDEEIKLRMSFLRAELKEAETALDTDSFVQSNVDRLIEQQKLTELEAEWIEKKVPYHKARMDRSKAEIDMLDGSSDLSQLNSPIAGVVAKKHVNDGDKVAEGQVLVEVVRSDPIRLVVDVDVSEVAAMEKDPEVGVVFPLLGAQVFSGTVSSVGTQKKEMGGMVEVKVHLPNSEGKLKPGMLGQMTARTKEKTVVYPVPETVLERTERSVYVYRVENNKLHRLPVKLVEGTAGQQLLVKQGLKENDQLALLGEELLKDGMKVEIRKNDESKK